MNLLKSKINFLFHRFSKFLDYSSFSKDFKILCFYQVILSLANGMLGLFLPIFFFKIFSYSIYWVIIFFGVSYLLYSIFLPFGAMLMSKIGLKTSMILGRFIMMLFYLTLFFISKNVILFSVLAEVILLIFRLLYWVPYHTDFAKFTEGKLRGREIAFIRSLIYLVGIIAPIIAGLILSRYDFNYLFIVALFVMAISLLPLAKISPTKEHYSFSYLQTFKVLFKKSNRNGLIAYSADGAQGFIGIVVWPVFIFQILHQKYVAIGSISALIIALTIISQLFIGNYTDVFKKKKIIKLGSILYSFGWILKGLVVTAFNIVFAGIFQNLSALVLRTPFDALFYEKAADHGSYIDEYTVLKEMALNLGRAVIAAITLLLILFWGIRVSFYLAAIVSLLVNLL